MCVGVLLVFKSVYHIHVQVLRKALGLLGLELQMVSSCHLGAGNQTCSLCKNSQCSDS